MNNPIVTVLMPVFNGEKYLSQAIESILNQTFADFEFLIINDGSTDRSETIISSYPDPRIRYIKNETNLGIIKTLNLGIDLSKGSYIARMDCDDICVLNRLEKQAEILNKDKSCDLVASKILLIDENGNRAGYWEDDILTTSYEEIKGYISKLNCIAHPSIMIRTETARLYKYRTNQKHSEDWDLWLRLLSDNRIIKKLDETLLYYRIHSDSITTQANKNNVYGKIFRVQRNFLLNKIRSKRKLNDFDKQVLKSSFESFDKAFLKGRIIKYGKRLKKFLNKKIVSKIYGRIQFLKVLIKFLNSSNQSGIYFFFPFYHVGGAERVHIDILNVVKDKRPFIFITNKSENKAFLKEFESCGELFYIGEMGKIRKKIWERVIIKTINNDKSLLFGCNSYFFYSILPKIKPEAKIIDLIHAFSGNDYKAAEDWSLPHVERINKRVFISNRTIEDLKNQYLHNNISSDLLKRIVYISNYTYTNQNYHKEIKEEIEVIFVGRGSKEKRVHLIGKIARGCNLKNLPFSFTIIGNVKDSMSKEYHPYLKFQGEISDPRKINKIYSKSHIILITSEREGMPMVIMEGMANGVVPVCTSVGDIPIHVIKDKTGYIVSNDLNEDDIVSSFIQILEELNTNRSKLMELSRNSYEYAKEKFGKEKFERAYKDLLNQ